MAEAGRGVIVVNTSFRIAPWADVLYAMDRAWWREYQDEAAEVFTGRFWSPLPNLPGVKKAPTKHTRNSGAGAIALAAHLGAQRIIMLGYDCQRTNGMAHWHGNHPKGLGNAGSLPKWPAQFAKLADELDGTDVVNASRETALTIFPRVALEEALQ